VHSGQVMFCFIVYRTNSLYFHVTYVVATTAAPTKKMCVVTLDAYMAVHGRDAVEGMNSSVGDLRDSLPPFGWTEMDGFPANITEEVNYLDSVPVYHEVHINPCYSWYVLADRRTHDMYVV